MQRRQNGPRQTSLMSSFETKMHFNNLRPQFFQSLNKLFTNFTIKKRGKNSVPFTSSRTLNHVRVDEKDKSTLNSQKSYILLLQLSRVQQFIVYMATGDFFFLYIYRTCAQAQKEGVGGFLMVCCYQHGDNNVNYHFKNILKESQIKEAVQLTTTQVNSGQGKRLQ